ncbi:MULTISPECIES: channel accessory protein ArfB [Mycobacteriaceae]|jgi:uncharacterized membrane protein ArfB|uniref:channel accessory protein ArfB n=1 Tax=Mycobacteriaceae TaxID=1762 RepID=UPI001403E05F|nr:hypothetical protein [Mycolicibacter senuensis]
MDFVMQWLWYLLAFVVGSAIAWLLTIVSIRRTSREDAIAALPGSPEMGAD